MATLSLIGRISLNATQWQSGLKNLESDLKGSAGKMAGIFGVAFSKNPIFGALAAGGEIFGLSKLFNVLEEKFEAMQERLRGILRGTALTGLEADTFQRLANVFTAAGSNPEAIARPMQALESALEKVRAGGPEAVKVFTALSKVGASWEQIMRGDTQDVFLSIFDKLKGAAGDAGKLAALKEVFGRQGLELLPAAAIGLGSKAAEGGILSDTEHAEMEELKKRLGELQAFWRDTGLEAEKATLKMKVALSDPQIWLRALGSALAGPKFKLAEFFFGADPQAEFTEQGRAAQAKLDELNAQADAKRVARFKEQLQDEKDAKDIDRIIEKQEQLRLAKLSPEKRRQELQTQVDALAAKGVNRSIPEQEKFIDLQLVLARMGTGLDKFSAPADSLRSIGNLLGSDPNSRATQDRLTEIRDILREIRMKTRTRPGSEIVFPI